MSDATISLSGLTLTPSAVRRIVALRQKEGKPSLRLRITVQGGGCSGFRYEFVMDEKTVPGDVTFGRDGAEVVTDPVSLELIAGSEVDFVDSLMGSYFQVNNPQAASSCGCGASFSR
ncbi:MAG: iron-sulfur cluster insertion protein ErpA [Pseudomonadota bacterium]|nr:iron-sulfur cluster insertion protein ErpA [Pseudomonadota bacterium]